jgi:hypothetical protein
MPFLYIPLLITLTDLKAGCLISDRTDHTSNLLEVCFLLCTDYMVLVPPPCITISYANVGLFRGGGGLELESENICTERSGYSGCC